MICFMIYNVPWSFLFEFSIDVGILKLSLVQAWDVVFTGTFLIGSGTWPGTLACAQLCTLIRRCYY